VYITDYQKNRFSRSHAPRGNVILTKLYRLHRYALPRGAWERVKVLTFHSLPFTAWNIHMLI